MSTGNETFDPYAQWLGLNLREQPLDHYLLLGLNRYEADHALIERQADERMRLVRSFQTGPRGWYTQKLMNELATAKLCLLSPAAKRAYDQQLELWSQGASGALLPAEGSGAEEGAAELPPAATLAAAMAPPVVPPPAAPFEFAPPLPPEAPPIATGSAAATDDEANAAEEESAETPMAMVVVGLILGLMGLGIAVWMLSSFAMHQGWIAGGPPPGGPPAGMVGRKATNTRQGQTVFDAAMPAGEQLAPAPGDEEAIEVLQEGSGDVVLSPATAVVAGGVELELEGTAEVLAGWSSPEDFAAWSFRLVQPGFFEAQITYTAEGAAFGRELELSIDGQPKTLELQPTSDGFRTDLLTIAVPKSGPHELRVSQTSAFDGGLRVKLIRLKAVAAAGR